MKINGSLQLVQDTSGTGVSFLENAVIERFTTTEIAAFSTPDNIAGRIVYNSTTGQYNYYNGSAWLPFSSGGGTVTSVSVVTANGVSGSVATSSTTPAITLTLGAITPTSVVATGSVTGSNLSGTNTGDQTITLTGDVTGSGTGSFAATLATVNANVGTIGDSTHVGQVTVNAKGLVTAATAVAIAFPVTSVSGTTNRVSVTPTTGAVVVDIDAAYVGQASITTLGTVTTGVWNGTTIAIGNGGTGQTSKTAAFDALSPLTTTGDLIAWDGTAGHNVRVPVGTAGQVLTANTGATAGVSWNDVATGTVTSVDISTTSAGVTVGGGPITSTGTLTVNLNAELQALSALAATGFVVRTGTATYTERSISGTAGRVTVTNGNGVTASPTIDLATVTDTGTGTFLKVTTDTFGRVTGTTAVVAGDITALVDATYVNVTGDSMSGNLTMTSGATVTGLPTPSASGDAAPKSYVDSAINGLSWKNAVAAASVANVSITSAPTAVDGHTLVAGDRVLLKNQTTDAENGIYVFTAAAAALTRSTDGATFGELNDAALFVINGTVNGGTGYIQTAPLTAFTGQNWTVFSTGGAYLAGTGLTLTSHTFSVNMGAGIVELPTGEVGIDLFGSATSALILTTDGTTRSTVDTAQLSLLLASAGGLTQDATGLFITTAGVTNAMLTNSIVTLDVDGGGSSNIALGGTLAINGVSTQGVSTNVTGTPGSAPVVTVTVANAGTTSSNKGVSWFDPAFFSATSGEISLNGAGDVTFASVTASNLTAHGAVYADSAKKLQTRVLTNGQLMIGSTGADPVAATLTGGASIGITNAAGAVTVDVLCGGGDTFNATFQSGYLQYTGAAGGKTLGGNTNFLVGTALPLPGGGTGPALLVGSGVATAAIITDAVLSGTAGINLQIAAGETASGSSDHGGALTLFGGAAANGTGGTATLQGGTSVAGAAGLAQVIGGNSTTGAAGGVLIAGGTAGTNANGGTVTIAATAGNGTGLAGDVVVKSGSTVLFTFVSTGALAINGTSAGTSGQVLTSAGAGASPTWSTPSVGSVTSVAVSGGTTGLSTTGGPITTTGTITLTGTLISANGGTGVDNSTGAVGKSLVATATGVFTAKSTQFIATGTFAAGTPSTVTHNLGTQFVTVQVYAPIGTSPETYEQIIPQSIVLSSNNAVAVTVNSALVGAVVVVSGVPGVTMGSF